MKKITCEVCGNSEIVLQKDKFVCQKCGIKYSAEHLRNMFEKANSENIELPEQKQETKQEENKDDFYIQEIEKALIFNDIEKARELIYFISDYNKAQLLKCRLLLTTGTISDTKFKEAINRDNYCLDKQGFEYLAVFLKKDLILYRYLSVKHLIEYFLKHLQTFDCNTSIETINKDRKTLFDLFKSFGEVMAFCERNNLVWEFCLALKERKLFKTEEEVSNTIEKIKKEVEWGQAENYYDFFIKHYKKFAKAANKAFLDKKPFDQDSFVLSFFNKFVGIVTKEFLTKL